MARSRQTGFGGDFAAVALAVVAAARSRVAEPSAKVSGPPVRAVTINHYSVPGAAAGEGAYVMPTEVRESSELAIRVFPPR